MRVGLHEKHYLQIAHTRNTEIRQKLAQSARKEPPLPPFESRTVIFHFLQPSGKTGRPANFQPWRRDSELDTEDREQMLKHVPLQRPAGRECEEKWIRK